MHRLLIILQVCFLSLACQAQNLKMAQPGLFAGAWIGARELLNTISKSVQNAERIETEAQKRENSFSLFEVKKSFQQIQKEKRERIQELRREIAGSHDVRLKGDASQDALESELRELVSKRTGFEVGSTEVRHLVEFVDLAPGVLEQPAQAGPFEKPDVWMAPQTQPQAEAVPAGLRQDLPDAWIPWGISTDVFNRLQPVPNASYRRTQILPTDPEWRFVWRYFYHDKPTRYGIRRVFCVHNRDQTGRFETNLATLEQDARAFPATWNKESRADQRAQAMTRFTAATTQFSPFQTMESDGRRRTWNQVQILPVWHGSDESRCGSIANAGFTFFGKVALSGTASGSTDDGYFGSGMYFTNSARYAGDIYSHGHLLMSWVSMTEPFPVVGDAAQEDMKVLRSRGAYKNYNAHYIPVVPKVPDTNCPEYFPCQPGEAPVCDELVVFQRAQALPRYWVELQVEHPGMTTPSSTPAFVEDLIPHLFRVLEHPPVDADKKLRNRLNRELARLMTLQGDDDLEAADSALFGNLMGLLDNTGRLIKSVRDALTGTEVQEAERRAAEKRAEAALEAQQAMLKQEMQQRSSTATEEARLRQELQQRRMTVGSEKQAEEAKKKEAARQEAVKVVAAQKAEEARLAAASRPTERVARTTAITANPLKRAADWYKGPRTAQQVGALEWEMGHKGSEKMTFKEAQAYAASRSREGWRLPTIFELEALYQQRSALGDDLDTNYFWSDTAVVGVGGCHWLLSFVDGDVGGGGDGSCRRVRLVRG